MSCSDNETLLMFFFFLIYTLSVLIVTFRHTAMFDEIPYWKPSVKSVCDSNFHAQTYPLN